MIRLAEIIKTFLPDLEQKYGSRLLPSHRQALAAIEQCRTQALGTAAIHCDDCDSHEVFRLSCGHRFCPQCQHEAGETWLERQRAKLLPVDYYLIAFTLPATLRALVYDHQREAYDLLIRLAWQTLAAFGLRDKALHGDLGATVVLHTHSRALDCVLSARLHEFPSPARYRGSPVLGDSEAPRCRSYFLQPIVAWRRPPPP